MKTLGPAGLFMACLCVQLAAGPAAARPRPPAPPPPDPDACGPAIEAAEKKAGLPGKLLGSIALVESGQPDPVTGKLAPWPWTINAHGDGWFFPSKAEAIAAVREFQAAGVQSIDVGCMQVNLMFHPDAFASLEEAFDPAANAAYGARFLSALYRQTGYWPQATAAYHSLTPELGLPYAQKVMAIWPLAADYPDLDGPPPPAALLAAAPAVLPGVAPPGAATPAARAKPERRPEEVYTTEFAARTRQIDADLAKLAASLGPVLAPAKPAMARPARPHPRLEARAF